jgi:hypothetical protein
MSYRRQRARYRYGPRGFSDYHDTTPHGTRMSTLTRAEISARLQHDEDVANFWAVAF